MLRIFKHILKALPLRIELALIQLNIDLISFPNEAYNPDNLLNLQLRKQYLQTKINDLW